MKEIIRTIKVYSYIRQRRERKRRFTMTYLKSLHNSKFKRNDIVFVPDIRLVDNTKIPRIYKYKVLSVFKNEDTSNTQTNIGPSYSIVHLNAKSIDGYRFSSYEREMYSSYSQAFERLKTLATIYNTEIKYNNWIDFPY